MKFVLKNEQLIFLCNFFFSGLHPDEDMSDLAVDYSICPSKEEGGMLGWVRRGQMVCTFPLLLILYLFIFFLFEESF